MHIARRSRILKKGKAARALVLFGCPFFWGGEGGCVVHIQANMYVAVYVHLPWSDTKSMFAPLQSEVSMRWGFPVTTDDDYVPGSSGGLPCLCPLYRANTLCAWWVGRRWTRTRQMDKCCEDDLRCGVSWISESIRVMQFAGLVWVFENFEK